MMKNIISRKIFIPIAMILTLGTVPVSAEECKSAQELFANRLKSASQKNPQKAIEALTKDIAKAPNDPWAYAGRAHFYVGLKQYEKAIADCNKSIANKPDKKLEYIVYFIRGQALGNLKNFKQSLASMNKAIELNPKTSFLYEGRGDVYQMQNKFKLAIKDYSKALDLEPDFHMARYGKARSYYGLGEFKKSLQEFNELISSNPKDGGYYRDRAAVYQKLGKMNLAVQDLNKSKELGYQ